MKCNHVEDRLPFYVENEIDAAERREIDSHLASCHSCGESLAVYVQLEASLMQRRERVPAVGPFATRVMQQVGYGRRHDFLRVLVEWPAMLCSAFVTAGLLVLFGVNPFQGTLERFSDGVAGHEIPVLDWVNRWITLMPDDTLALSVLYSGILALVLLIGSLMVLRHVRD